AQPDPLAGGEPAVPARAARISSRASHSREDTALRRTGARVALTSHRPLAGARAARGAGAGASMTDIKTKTPIDTRDGKPATPGESQIDAQLASEPKPEVVAQLRPEVKAELRSDVRTTLEEMASTGRSVEERFARRVRINSPRRHNAKLNELLRLINDD